MALVTARNVTGAPLRVDRAGRVAPAGGYVTVDDETAPASTHIKARRLRVIAHRDDEHVSDEARAAFEATDNAVAEADRAAMAAPDSTPGEPVTLEENADDPLDEELEATPEPTADEPTRPAKRATRRRTTTQEA